MSKILVIWWEDRLTVIGLESIALKSQCHNFYVLRRILRDLDVEDVKLLMTLSLLAGFQKIFKVDAY